MQGKAETNWEPYMVEYHYDLEDPSRFGSKNNRLEYAHTYLMASGTPVGDPVSTSWYYYTTMGNVRRIVKRDYPINQQQNMMAVGGESQNLTLSSESLLLSGESLGAPGVRSRRVTRLPQRSRSRAVFPCRHRSCKGSRLRWRSKAAGRRSP